MECSLRVLNQCTQDAVTSSIEHPPLAVAHHAELEAILQLHLGGDLQRPEGGRFAVADVSKPLLAVQIH